MAGLEKLVIIFHKKDTDLRMKVSVDFLFRTVHVSTPSSFSTPSPEPQTRRFPHRSNAKDLASNGFLPRADLLAIISTKSIRNSHRYYSKMSSSSGDSEVGAWAALSFPLSDIFLHEIAPKFLTIRDFLSLGAVSRRYKDLLGPKTAQGSRILGHIILHSARHYAASGELLYIEQLPTIGDFSVEESLAENPILVAQLRQSALRRRSIKTFPMDVENYSEQDWAQQQEVISQHRAKSSNEIRTVVRKYRRTIPMRKPNSKFLGVNLSGVNIYIHWIDRHGHIIVRDGDCVPPHRDQNQSQPESFVVPGTPQNVFDHWSFLYHSFAICFSEGGPPFAIYQQRRGYCSRVGQGFHAHAIAILPGGRVHELHCDVQGRPHLVVNFRCRRTGNILPGSGAENSMRRDDNRNVDNAEDNTTASVEEGNENRNTQNAGDNPQDSNSVIEMTEEYYGLDVPSGDPIQPQDREAWMRCLRNANVANVSYVNPLGEAMYREWIKTGPVATGIPVDPR